MKRIGLVIFPGFQILDLVAVSVFEVANSWLEKPEYDVHLLSEYGGQVTSSSGVRVDSERFDEREYDTMIVTGSLDIPRASDGVLQFLRDASARSRRTASICTGAFLMAESGLLDGRRATTHWRDARTLQRRFPKIRVEEDKIFVIDDSIWTSAGMTAGIDLCLAMVDRDLGVEISRSVAKGLVVHHRRAGGQSQYSSLLDLEPRTERIQDALTYAKNNLDKPLQVEDLAEVAHLSPRQFSRTFRSETGQSPAKAIENLRVDAARMLLEDARHTIDAVAMRTGFADTERMRRAFLRAYGHPPQAIRRAARASAG
ncbi:AraC family transcriptional regulator, transcriptional activator FtrA [Pararobbsia alpina]|uniref:GlxA family transcriptional regulator n=1 Tax=Pararobbsia alpina TaxID=621374 RepID=UPI0039A77F56